MRLLVSHSEEYSGADFFCVKLFPWPACFLFHNELELRTSNVEPWFRRIHFTPELCNSKRHLRFSDSKTELKNKLKRWDSKTRLTSISTRQFETLTVVSFGITPKISSKAHFSILISTFAINIQRYIGGRLMEVISRIFFWLECCFVGMHPIVTENRRKNEYLPRAESQ